MSDEDISRAEVDAAVDAMRKRGYVLPDPDAGLVYALSALGNALKRRDEIVLDLQQQNEALIAEQSELRVELVRKSDLLDEAMALLHEEDEEPERLSDAEEIASAGVSQNGSGDADVRL